MLYREECIFATIERRLSQCEGVFLGLISYLEQSTDAPDGAFF